MLTGHLLAYSSISLLVQRSELFFKDAVVYGDTADTSTENLAFRLYADGVRELTLREGLSEEDVAFFLDVLWTGTEVTANLGNGVHHVFPYFLAHARQRGNR